MHIFFTCTIELGRGWGERGVVSDSHQACPPMCVRPGGLKDNSSPSSVSRDPGENPGEIARGRGFSACSVTITQPHLGHAGVESMKKTSSTCIHPFLRPYRNNVYLLSSHFLYECDCLVVIWSSQSVFVIAWCWPALTKYLTACCFTLLLLHHSIVHRHSSIYVFYLELVQLAIPSNLFKHLSYIYAVSLTT